MNAGQVRNLVVASCLIASCQALASDWKLAVMGGDCLPANEKVAREERPAILRVAVDKLGLTRVQMARPT